MCVTVHFILLPSLLPPSSNSSNVKIVFCVAQLTLLLTPDNYEFELTIILVVVAVVAYFVVQLTASSLVMESKYQL